MANQSTVVSLDQRRKAKPQAEPSLKPQAGECAYCNTYSDDVARDGWVVVQFWSVERKPLNIAPSCPKCVPWFKYDLRS